MEADENFADLIEKNTDVDWAYLEQNMPKMKTEELVEALLDLNLYVNKPLALEIAKRNDAVFWLRKLLQDGSHWYSRSDGSGWAPIHAVHILSLIKTKESLELLLDIIRYCNEGLSDWLTDSCPLMLVYFGEEAIERLKAFTKDETLEAFSRAAGTTALLVLSVKLPQYKSEIKEHFMALLNTSINPTFVSIIAQDIAEFHDASVLPDIQKAFERKRADNLFTNVCEVKETIDGVYKDSEQREYEMHTKNPLEHFSRKNIEYLQSVESENERDEFEEETPKVGRNEPCPCGSGKKYKKCCWLKDTNGTKSKFDNFWSAGGFSETMTGEEAKKKMKTFHKRHDEDMNFSCEKCKKKISAHNKDWHGGMCDECFEKEGK